MNYTEFDQAKLVINPIQLIINPRQPKIAKLMNTLRGPSLPMMQQPLAQSTTAFLKKHALERQRETPNPASYIDKRATSNTTP